MPERVRLSVGDRATERSDASHRSCGTAAESVDYLGACVSCLGRLRVHWNTSRRRRTRWNARRCTSVADIEDASGNIEPARLHRNLSRATIMQLANSLAEQEPLRQIFPLRPRCYPRSQPGCVAVNRARLSF